ncbi:hypothetical protein BDY24DRAFT_371217 [Mrakia frigida]|uniref:uncharacterized protein n=1 Tax=Mrakia frigida TaxID=29902 RepID=UPI003FCC0BDB
MQSATSHSSSPLKSKRKYSDDNTSFEGGGEQALSHSSPTHKHARRLNLSSLPKRTPSFASSRSGTNQVPPPLQEDVGMMDVDNGSTSSDSDELELPTPSFPYPSNLQYPFGLTGGVAKQGGGGVGGAQAQHEGMSVDEVQVGLRGPKAGQLHGSQCTSIPRVVLSHPLPSGERSLWSVCQDCGAVSPC